MTITTVIHKEAYCDFCGKQLPIDDNGNIAKKNIGVPIPCLRMYDQEECKVLLKEPSVEIAFVDLCEEHFKQLVVCDIIGAQGNDCVIIKDNDGSDSSRTRNDYFGKKNEIK